MYVYITVVDSLPFYPFPCISPLTFCVYQKYISGIICTAQPAFDQPAIQHTALTRLYSEYERAFCARALQGCPVVALQRAAQDWWGNNKAKQKDPYCNRALLWTGFLGVGNMRERKLSKEREGSKAEIDGDTLVCMSAQEDVEYDFVMWQQTRGMNKKHRMCDRI